MAVFNLLKGYLKGEAEQQNRRASSGLLKKLLPGASKEEKVEASGAKKNKVFVFFMTDGCDTCNDKKSIMLVSATESKLTEMLKICSP